MKFLRYLLLTAAACMGQTLNAQTPAQIKAMLPEVPEWKIAGQIEVFGPENLWDRINGAAPLFLENNFREMTSMQYTKGEEYITVQAYRHASPVDAFGMYASERSSGLKFFPYGAEAQGDDKNMYFFAGNIYVKMWSSAPEDLSEVLGQIAKGFAANIDPEANYPKVLQVFPENGKVAHSEAYISSSYLGHEFLHSAYTADYRQDGRVFQIFVIDAGSKKEASDMLSKWLSFAGQSQDSGEGKLLVKDKYNGDVQLFWTDRFIIGIFSEDGNAKVDGDNTLEDISDNLTRLVTAF